MTPGTHEDWKTAPLVALDLEGSGAQDRENEAILEIAVVPVTGGCPEVAPAGLLDTLRLARSLKLGSKNSLTALIDQLDLTSQVERLASGSQPHRALWDTVATALLLPALVARRWPSGAGLVEITEAGGADLSAGHARPAGETGQQTLF